MAKRRSAVGRRMQRQANTQTGIAVTNYVAGGSTALVAGMAGATGNLPMAATFGTATAGFIGAGAMAQRRGNSGRARAAAVDNLVRRARRGNAPLRGGAGNDMLATSTASVDALAYTANTAATISGSQMARGTRKSLRPRASAAPPTSLGTKAARAFAQANPFVMATAGGVMAKGAFDIAKASGATNMQALGAGAVAAAPMAAAAVAPTIIGRAAPDLAKGLSKAALPLLALSTAIAAARGGYNAYQNGAGAGGVIGGAALGAADSLTFGLASKAVDRVAPVAKAYLNPAAQAKAQKSAPGMKEEGRGRSKAAALPSSDGMTAGYTRVDPRTGRTVRVEGYKTPT